MTRPVYVIAVALSSIINLAASSPVFASKSHPWFCACNGHNHATHDSCANNGKAESVVNGIGDVAVASSGTQGPIPPTHDKPEFGSNCYKTCHPPNGIPLCVKRGTDACQKAAAHYGWPVTHCHN